MVADLVADANAARPITAGGTGAVTAVAARAALGAASKFGFSVKDYGAVANGTTDDSAAFIAAQTAAISAGMKLIVVPEGNYRINATIQIDDDVNWLFLGAALNTSLDTMTILSADEVHGWSILGRCELVGTLSVADVEAQVGLAIESCDRYYVEGVSARNLKGKGFYVYGTSEVAPLRGDRGQFVGCSAFDCTVGRQLDAGAGAEFTVWTNWLGSGCATADIIGAGNTKTVGFSLVDNGQHVSLVGGTNHGHGIYSGGSMNHATVKAMRIENVDNGFTFNAVHIYDGTIEVNSSSNVTFLGGMLDVASIVLTDTSTGEPGPIRFKDMFMPGSYGPLVVSGAMDHFAVFQGCTGPESINLSSDGSYEAIAYASGAGSQGFADGVAEVVVFPDTSRNQSGAYNASTGEYTCFEDGVYEVSWNMIFQAAGGGAAVLETASYVSLQFSTGAAPSTFDESILLLPGKFGDTLLSFSGTVRLATDVGSRIRLQASIQGTGTLSLGSNDWLCTFGVRRVG